MGEERSVEEDFSKLTTSELLEHKSWKARIKGYEDVCLQMQQASSEKDQLFSKYIGGIKSWVSDSNVVALEKGLEAVYVFVENAAVANRTAQDICPVLIQKCLAHAKAKIQKKSQDILLMYIEIEKADVVTDALIEGFSSKNPKVIAQCVVCFTLAVSVFGVKAINIKNVMKQIAPLLDHRDKDVREQAKSLSVELFRWIGDVALKPQLQNIKPLQMSELEAEFEKEKEKDVKRSPSRYLRSQRPQETTVAADGSESGMDSETAPSSSSAAGTLSEGVDAWTFLEPTDLLSKLPKDFYEQIESSKWLERKECLEALLKLCVENPRLDPTSNYGELISVLKKIISKDSNINVVGTAAKCAAALASGLRKKFAPFNSMLVPIILEKFKEKKAVVANACTEAIDAIFKTTTLEALSEDIIAALDNKTPSVKIQTALFLSRSFAATHSSLFTKKLIKLLSAALVKGIGTSDPEVRDSSASALGSLLKAAGEKDVMPFLAEIKDDHLKMDKIREYCAKTVLDPSAMACGLAAAPGPSKPASKKTEQSSGPPAKQSVKTGETKPSDGDKAASSDSSAASASGSSKAASNAKKTNDAKSKESAPRDSGLLIDTNQKHQRFQEEKALKILKWNFTTPTEEHVEQLQNQLATVCKPTLHCLLFHSNFKQHLKAIEMLLQCSQNEPDASVSCSDLLLKWSTLRFFETNPSVLIKTLEYLQILLQLLIDRNLEMHDFEIGAFLPYVLLKSGDQKDAVRQEVRKLLHKLAKLHPAAKIFPFLLDACQKTKNSRQKAECIEQMGAFIDVLGVGVCGTPPTQSLRQLAQCIGDKDNAVRNATLNAFVAAYNKMGDKLYKSIGAISEKDFAMLQERIKRSSKLKPGEMPNVAGSTASLATSVAVEKRPKTAQAALGRQSPIPQSAPQNGPMDSSADCRERKLNLSERNWADGDSHQSKGQFRLEMSKIFDQRQLAAIGSRSRLPEMSLRPEVAQILQDPYQMPRINRRSPTDRRPATAVGFSTTPGPCSNEDVLSMLDTTISQVTSSSINTALQSLVQLDEIMKDPTKLNFLIGKVDQLLMAVYFQLRLAYNTHMKDNTVNQQEVLRLYRHLCVVLLSLSSAGTLIQEASDCALKDLICQLLTVLIDERLKITGEGSELIRSINYLLSNFVNKSDPTCCFVALIRLLRDTLHSQTASTKFKDLVMKCLWKLTSQIPAISDKLHVDRILLECHQFFTDFPLAVWKQMPSNTPMRTIKTILNSLCNVLGDKILDHVGSVEKAETSEAIIFVKKCLDEIYAQKGHAQSRKASSTSTGMSNGFSRSSNLTEESRAQFSRIIKKIAVKEHSHEGLIELHEFLQCHPEFDMNHFYRRSNCNEHFRQYIESNLKRLENERGQLRKKSNADVDNEGCSSSVTSESAISSIEALQRLRERGGLMPCTVLTPLKPNSQRLNTEMGLPDIQKYDHKPQLNHGDSLSGSRFSNDRPVSESDVQVDDDISDLKMRLEKIKHERGQ